MKKLFRRLHLWLSLPAGLVIFVICTTGAILVFEKEINESLYPERYFVEDLKPRELSIAQLAARIDNVLATNKETRNAQIASVEIANDPRRTVRFNIAADNPRNQPAVHIDPYTGHITAQYLPGDSPFRTVMALHRWLLDKPSDSLGKQVVGIATMLFALILFTGIVIWIPKSKKKLKSRLQIRLTKGWKPFWRDLHAAGGIYAASILLVLALTGLTWSYDWYRTGFYSLLGATMPPRTEAQGKPKSSPQEEAPKTYTLSQSDSLRLLHTAQYQAWDIALQEIHAEHPSYTSIFLQEGKARAVLGHTVGNVYAADNYTFGTDGHLLSMKPYASQDAYSKLSGLMVAIHVGSWGGLTTKILFCIVALIGASLPLTGYYIYYKRLRKKFKKKFKKGKKRKEQTCCGKGCANCSCVEEDRE